MMVTDKYGYIEYYLTYRPELNNLKEREVLGKHITDIYPGLDNNTSSIMRVLKTGIPITNEYQMLSTFKGQSIKAVNTTLPIKDNDEIIGAVDVSPDYPQYRPHDNDVQGWQIFAFPGIPLL